MSKSTDVTEVKNTSITTSDGFGHEGLDSSDMLISRLALQQPLSKFVTEGKAGPGDIVDSVTGEILAKKNTEIEVIPVMSFKDWHVSHIINNQQEFQGKFPFNQQTALWQKEEIVDGIQVKRDLALNFFVLIRGKENELPYLLTFKRTSYYQGRKMSTVLQKNKMLGKSIAHVTFKLSGTIQTFEKFTYFIINVENGTATTGPEQLEAMKWNDILSAKKHAVDSSGDEA